MIKNARETRNKNKNPRHVHTSVRPHESYRGLAYCYRGVTCCSFCEGDYKLADGSFDVAGAQRAALAMNKAAMNTRRMARNDAAHYERQTEIALARARNPYKK